jgi:hypothetical protein
LVVNITNEEMSCKGTVKSVSEKRVYQLMNRKKLNLRSEQEQMVF